MDKNLIKNFLKIFENYLKENNFMDSIFFKKIENENKILIFNEDFMNYIINKKLLSNYYKYIDYDYDSNEEKYIFMEIRDKPRD